MRGWGLLAILLPVGLAACAPPDVVGQQVGRSLYDASVNTGRALSTAGERTGQAIQNAGTNLRNAVNPPPYNPGPPPLPPPYVPQGWQDPAPGAVTAAPLAPTSGYDPYRDGPRDTTGDTMRNTTPANPSLGY
jgi:hypothetical protein